MTDLRSAAQRLLIAIDNSMPAAPLCAEFDIVADAADELRAALAQQAEPALYELVEMYSRPDGRRQWSSVGAWLYPGDRIVIMRDEIGQAQVAEDTPPAPLEALQSQLFARRAWVNVACWCESCDVAANAGFRTRMSVCNGCGDKRCPRAAHHGNECSKTPNVRGEPGRDD